MTRAELEVEVAAGRITKEDKVELLAGRIVDVMTEGSPHAAVQRGLTRQLYAALDPDAWIVSPSHPIALSDVDEPEPDLAVLRARADDYFHSHPGPDDVALVIEIAQSSQRRDTVLKAERYALAGIPEYWVVDLVDQVTIVHRHPDLVRGDWDMTERHPAGTAITPARLGGVDLTPLA